MPIFLSKNKNMSAILINMKYCWYNLISRLKNYRHWFKNVKYFPNFKNIAPIEKLTSLDGINLKVSVFSRVVYDKGIEYG